MCTYGKMVSKTYIVLIIIKNIFYLKYFITYTLKNLLRTVRCRADRWRCRRVSCSEFCIIFWSFEDTDALVNCQSSSFVPNIVRKDVLRQFKPGCVQEKKNKENTGCNQFIASEKIKQKLNTLFAKVLEDERFFIYFGMSTNSFF